MATALDIINRAGKRAKILADEAAFTASEAVDALQLMNDMMHAFGPRGIAYVHTTLAATDTVNVPDELIRDLVLLLTEELLIDFDMPISEQLAGAILNAKNQMQAAYYFMAPAVTDPMLRPHRYGRTDITRLD